MVYGVFLIYICILFNRHCKLNVIMELDISIVMSTVLSKRHLGFNVEAQTFHRSNIGSR